MNPSAANALATASIQMHLLSDNQESADLLASMLDGEPGLQVRTSSMALGQGLRAVTRHQPHVVLVTETSDDLVAAVEALDAGAPGIPVLVLLAAGDVRTAQECGLAGARATLFKPVDRQRLIGAVRQVYSKEVRRRQEAATSHTGGESHLQRPRVVAVYGAKGGVGTTTLACNLAVALRQATGSRVALVEGDLLGNGAGAMLDLVPTRGIADLAPHADALEADMLAKVMVEHDTGVSVLLSPELLQHAEAVGAEDIRRLLNRMRAHFDIQVVDTASHLTPVTIAELDEADLIVLVVTPEIPALRNPARFLTLAGQLGYPREKVLLVINRANAGHEIGPDLIEEYFRRPVDAVVPSDGRQLVERLNAGELLLATRPDHRVSRAITGVARVVAGNLGLTESLRPATRPTAATAAPMVVAATARSEQSEQPRGEGRNLGAAAAYWVGWLVGSGALRLWTGLAALGSSRRRRRRWRAEAIGYVPREDYQAAGESRRPSEASPRPAAMPAG